MAQEFVKPKAYSTNEAVKLLYSAVPTVERMMVTPEIAEAWLRVANNNNRKIRQSKVDFYVKEIINGHYMCMVDAAIGFYRDLGGMNGQHRATAIKQAKIPVDMVVAFGLDPETRKVTDLATPRNMADRLGIDKAEAEICSFLEELQHGREGISALSVEPILENLTPYIHKLINTVKRTSRINSSAPVKAAAVMQMAYNVDNTEYICAVYKALVCDDVMEFPSVASAFYTYGRHHLDVVRRRCELFARASYVFDRENKSKTGSPQAPSIERYIQKARQWLAGIN